VLGALANQQRLHDRDRLTAILQFDVRCHDRSI
jgi:hypothetical protein